MVGSLQVATYKAQEACSRLAGNLVTRSHKALQKDLPNLLNIPSQRLHPGLRDATQITTELFTLLYPTTSTEYRMLKKSYITIPTMSSIVAETCAAII